MRNWSAFLLCICFGVLVEAEDNQAIFQSKILPVVAENCAKCHSGSKPQSDLAVTSYDSLLQGGKHGQAIVPNESADSIHQRREKPADAAGRHASGGAAGGTGGSHRRHGPGGCAPAG